MISREDRNYWIMCVKTKIDETIKKLCSEVDHVDLARAAARRECLIAAGAVNEYNRYSALVSQRDDLQLKVADIDRDLSIASTQIKNKLDKVYGNAYRYFDANSALDAIVTRHLNDTLAKGTEEQKHILELIERKDSIEFELMQETSSKMVVEAVKKIIDSL